MTEATLLPIITKYFEDDPVKAARLLETLPEEDAAGVLRTITPQMASLVVRHFNDGFASALLQMLPFPVFKEIIVELEPEQRASIFLNLPDHVRQLFLMQLEEKEKRRLQELLTYPEDSAGRMMSTDFLAFHSDMKVKDVIERLRRSDKKGNRASYAYVVDREHRLAGVMNMRDVVVAEPGTVVETIMRTNVFAIDGFMDREQIAEELSTRKYFAMPVIDSQKRLIGVVKADEVIGGMSEEATEDVQKMFGAGGDERSFSTVGFSLKKRLPWLHVNLATAFMAASVVAVFEDIIAKITILAVYLPVVAGQGGNAGAQSLAVVMRGLVMREIPAQKVKRMILKECFIGIVNGLIIGIVTGVIAWLWQGNIYLGIVIGLGMLVNLMIAGFAGAAIPLTMKAVGLDPAQCSNIILTTITDVMGFFAFLGFAVIFQDYLV